MDADVAQTHTGMPVADVPSAEDADEIEGGTAELEDRALLDPTIVLVPPTTWQRCSSAAGRVLATGIAFVLLALTTGIGIVVATYFEQSSAHLSSFGYTAVDQVLLPLTTLPLAAFLDSFACSRRLVGEPRWSPDKERPPTFLHTLHRVWVEVNTRPPPVAGPGAGPARHSRWLACLRPRLDRLYARGGCWCTPWPGWFALAPFHGLEFGRTLLFFVLITSYDADATYMTMTLLRIVLCWAASLAVCVVLRRWVGLGEEEARRALHPVNLAVKTVGSGLLILSVARLRGTA